MSISFFRSFFYAHLQELIKDQVANMYLWPKTLEIPILDLTKYAHLNLCDMRICDHD